jgi:DNA polymerase
MKQNSDRAAQLERIAQEVRNLSISPLYPLREEKGYLPVIGEGDLNASVMLVGEAPGEREAKSGRPFVGASGRFLDELLTSIGARRQDIYITNIVKDRPPENRDPSTEEIRLYAPFLLRQIEVLQPRLILTLGRFAMDFILELFNLPERGKKIGELHGRPLAAQAAYGPVTIVPLYHPAVALYNQDRRDTLIEDFKVVKQFL